MGNCATKNDGASSRTQKIDEELKQSRVALDNEIKILLLGAGDSGKSTLLKQMKIIHGKGFNEEERREFTERVQENIIQNMKSLVVAAEHFKLDVLEENEEKAEYFRALSPRENTFSEEVIDNVIALWKDPAIQQTLTRSSEFQLNNTAAYFFNRIEEIRKEDYIPSIDDVLRVRVKTTGISTSRFSTGGVEFEMLDVGGQRNERKKWIHCFQNVTSVIFCVGASEYDQGLYEDQSENRMTEALVLFTEICNSHWFQHTEMILFFNKDDLFREKINKVSLKTCFPDYEGGLDYEEAKDFLTKKFRDVNENQTKQIYVHFTTATNTENIQFVFSDIKEILLSSVKHL